MRKMKEGEEKIKPSMTYMEGGFEGGDVFSLKDGKYLGNNRSNFYRFYNDFWLTGDREDYFYLLIIFIIVFSILAGLGFIIGSKSGFSITMLILLSGFLFIYGIGTFIRSLKKFMEYKKAYKSLYEKWAGG